MKILKILLGFLIALILLVAILGIIAPKEFEVSRDVTIDAPKNFVFEQIRTLKNNTEWSPWAEKDPEMKKEITGVDGTVGSVYKWEGNEDVGKGEQEITEVTENSVTTELRFLEPWESNSTAKLVADEVDDGTKVTWTLSGDAKFPMSIFNLFGVMDKNLGPDFEKGLTNLKERSEGMIKGYKEKYKANALDMSAMHYIGVRDKVKFEKMSEFFGSAYVQIMEYMGANRIDMSGAPSGAYFTYDMIHGESELVAGIPVAKTYDVPEGMEMLTLPAGKALEIDYYGPYEGSYEPHNVMEVYMKEMGLKYKGPVVEEYITDPQSEPDQSKWHTKIRYYVE
jgi:effector-binding domain-containing protein